MKFLVDENLPKSLTQRLREEGHDVIDLRNNGKIGITDEEVMKIAFQNNCILITANYKHFANIIMFPPRNYPGIVVIKMPRAPITVMTERAIKAISSLKESDLAHSLIIVELHRIRKRK